MLLIEKLRKQLKVMLNLKLRENSQFHLDKIIFDESYSISGVFKGNKPYLINFMHDKCLKILISMVKYSSIS